MKSQSKQATKIPLNAAWFKKDKGDFEQRKPKYQSAPADYSDCNKLKGG